MADLVTLEEYKEYKGLKNSTEDSRRLALISSISKLVETYCDRNFKDYTVTPVVEYYSALDTDVYLRQFPVLEVVSVEVSADGGTVYDTLIESDPEKNGYLVDMDAGIIYTQNPRRPFLWWTERAFNSLRVTYRAGYEELPLDFKLAVFDLVHYYESEESTPSKSLMSGSIENPIPYDSLHFPSHISRILNMYRVGS